MQEIVQHKQDESVVLEKVTDFDAVFFRAIKVVNDVRFKFDIRGFIATISDDGRVSCEENNRKNCKIDEKVEKCVFKVEMIEYTITIILAVIYLMMEDDSVLKSIFHLLFEFAFALSLIPKAVTIFVYRLLGDKEMKSFSQILYAANSAQNAFYALGRVPTVEEAKKYSPYDVQNKYLPKLYWPTTVLALGFVNGVYGWNFLIICVLILITAVFLNRNNLLRFWQVLLISKADDIHYEAAIAAISEAVKWTETVEVKYTTVVVPTCFNPDKFPETKCLACNEMENCQKAKKIWSICAEAKDAEELIEEESV